MGLFSRVVKADDEFTWERKDRRKMHGSSPQWEGRTAQGNLRRMSEKPGRTRERRGRRP